MKNKVCLLLTVMLILSSILAFAACGDDEPDSNKIALTLNNYEQYISISARYYGEEARWSSMFSRYNYGYVVSSATISSTSSFVKFYDCIIEVRIVGEYYYTHSDKLTTKEVLKISLSLGGTGSEKKVKTVSNGNAHDIKGIGYEVVSVKGYVVVE